MEVIGLYPMRLWGFRWRVVGLLGYKQSHVMFGLRLCGNVTYNLKPHNLKPKTFNLKP